MRCKSTRLRRKQNGKQRLENFSNPFLKGLFLFLRIFANDKLKSKLRNIKGLTQEQVAEVIGISRQSYSKWEQGETYPDIDKCDKLAKYYGVTIDSLVRQDNKVDDIKIAPAPIGKHLWGTVTIGSKGQIVIPKAARETFELNEGDRLVVLGDDAEGIALVKADVFEQRVQEALKLSRQITNE